MKGKMPSLLTSKDVRNILNIKKCVFFNLMKGENPPPVYRIGRQYRFPEDEFYAWLAKQKLS
jgi:predicted DNA-binding transcriptional regulator AlpA